MSWTKEQVVLFLWCVLVGLQVIVLVALSQINKYMNESQTTPALPFHSRSWPLTCEEVQTE